MVRFLQPLAWPRACAQRLPGGEATMGLCAGERVGGFRLVEGIGEGGMASVWRAHHELLARDVALKLLPVGRSAPEVRARFHREAHIIGKFAHPNIVAVLDAGQLEPEGYLFLAMELLRGRPFADRLAPGRPLDPVEVLTVLIGVCHGLECAHAAGVVHRDVKPENVFLAATPEGAVAKLVDFGISSSRDACLESLTIEGQLLGTPAYMSPEQARGRCDIDHRTDLWSVGVMLHEALAGAPPFAGSTSHALLRAILDEVPAPLPAGVPADLCAVVARCLEKDAADRYPDAAALRADLERALERLGGGAEARPARSVAPAAPQRERASETTLGVPAEPWPARLRRKLLSKRTAVRIAAGIALVTAATAALLARASGEAETAFETAARAAAPAAAPAAMGAPPMATPAASAAPASDEPAAPAKRSPPARSSRMPPRQPSRATRISSPGF